MSELESEKYVLTAMPTHDVCKLLRTFILINSWELYNNLQIWLVAIFADYITVAFDEFSRDYYPKPLLHLVQDLWHAIQRVESTMVRSSQLYSRAKRDLRAIFGRFKVPPPEEG